MANTIQYGIYISNFGITSNPNDYLDLAVAAENAGWNGFYIWDHIYADNNTPLFDSWSVLSAISAKTKKIRLGTTVTGLARRRPWKVAREVATLDHLSMGRVTLGVGLGVDEDYKSFGEGTKHRGEMLDEALDVLTGLLRGEPFSYSGTHYTIDSASFNPSPVQTTIPIWIAGEWPNKKPFERAAKFNGVFPLRGGSIEPLDPDDFKEIIDYINKSGDTSKPYDVAHSIISSGDPEQDKRIEKYIDAGVNWFMECFYPGRGNLEENLERIERGPYPY